MTTPSWDSLSRLSASCGIKPHTLYARIVRHGYTLEEAVSVSLHGKKRTGRKGYIPRSARPCQLCGQFMVPGYNGHTCEACRTRVCEQCGSTFIRRGANRPNRFCTVRCQAEFQKRLTMYPEGAQRYFMDRFEELTRYANQGLSEQ